MTAVFLLQYGILADKSNRPNNCFNDIRIAGRPGGHYQIPLASGTVVRYKCINAIGIRMLYRTELAETVSIGSSGGINVIEQNNENCRRLHTVRRFHLHAGMLERSEILS